MTDNATAKIDVTQVLQGWNGKSIREGKLDAKGNMVEDPNGDLLTLRMIMTRALMTPLAGDDEIKPEAKLETHLLCVTIHQNDVVDLSPTNIATIKETIAKVFASAITGPAILAMDNRSKKK